jgi:hypothetical protein
MAVPKDTTALITIDKSVNLFIVCSFFYFTLTHF